MSNILLLRGFNNYHKRTILKYSTLDDYQDNSASFLNYSSINFNPNDGIVTEQIVGNNVQLENSKILSFDDLGSPDYLVVYETDSDNNVVIKSRWFILESVKTTAGQFRLALKRDVIADHMDWILNTDCFIEKAQIMDIYSPFIFNNESMTYNQIKKKEIPLYDSTGVPWIVGYVAKNYDGNGGANVTVTGKAINVENASAYEEEDLPFGTITQTMLDEGISFRTIESLNLFVKIKGFVGASNNIRTYAYMTGRSYIQIRNSEVSTIDNNYGLFYYALDDDSSHWNEAGSGLGSFTDQAITFTNNAQLTFAPTSYPKGSKIKSAQDIMNTLMAKSINGNSVADTIANEITATSITDWLGADIMQFDGEQVKIDDGNGGYDYYTMKVVFNGYTNGTDISNQLSASTVTSLMNLMNDTLNELDDITWYSNNQHPVFIQYGDYSIQFLRIPATMQVSTVLPAKNNRWGCNDQLFDIFCIPYGELNVTDDVTQGGASRLIVTNQQAGLAAARAMAQELGSNLYDLQILPYCPIKWIRDAYNTGVYSYIIEGTGLLAKAYKVAPYVKYTGRYEIDSDDASMIGSYQRIVDAYDSSVVYSYVFWATESHGTLDVGLSCRDDRYYQYDTPTNNKVLAKKISNESEIFRLCSPNYNGLFEYSPAKNNNVQTNHVDSITVVGNHYTFITPDITYINVDYTYRPGNPYIHLNPIFKGEDQGAIYGQDWNDIRGLICGGDFSLGYIVDAYRQYQIQNANFQNIFDRQLQNIDFNNALAKEQTQFASMMSAIGLPVGGATTGAIAGGKAGGVYGAIAGAAVGGTGGLVGGIAGYQLNMDWLERQQQETRSYAVDMYNYNLGNIKALPYSISRTDCLAENTRLVPFLEVYQATNAEIENLKRVLKYNGMTVMTVDKPINYIASSDISAHWENAIECHNKACYYIKAKLIMNTETELPDDFHIVDAIYAELDKGVYIQGYEEE